MRARRLAYAQDALGDIDGIRAYLRREAGGVAASRMIERIRAAIRKAREMPAAGVPRPEYRSSCRFVVARPYVIYYDFDGDALIVLRVLHQARDRDRLMGGETK